MVYQEGFGLPHDVALQILSRCKKMVSIMEASVNSLNRSLSSAKTAIEIEEKLLASSGSKDTELCFTRAVPIYNNLYACVKNNAMSLYQTAIATINEGLVPEEISQNSERKDTGEPQENDVIVHLEPDAIYVKTPMLWTKNGRKVRGINGKNLGPERVTFFRDDIVDGIKNSPDFPSYDISIFEKKIVHFLYVYSEVPTNKIFITDNDNHETKYVQDAVTMLLPGGDSPFSCSTFSSAALSTKIPGGTYITVTSMKEGIKSDVEIIKKWAEILSRAAT